MTRASKPRAKAGTKRRYRMSKRRGDIDKTRQRIIEAAVHLHGTAGPAQTTFSAVAERAGVQRSTLYRHFPDEASLFGACTTHWLAHHPWPRPQAWRAIADPGERLAQALADLYRYYEENQAMIGNSFRDFDVMPESVQELMRSQLDDMRQALLEGWPDAPGDPVSPSAAIAHALDFTSWRSLTAHGLSGRDAAALMARMIVAATTA